MLVCDSVPTEALASFRPTLDPHFHSDFEEMYLLYEQIISMLSSDWFLCTVCILGPVGLYANIDPMFSAVPLASSDSWHSSWLLRFHSHVEFPSDKHFLSQEWV